MELWCLGVVKRNLSAIQVGIISRSTPLLLLVPVAPHLLRIAQLPLDFFHLGMIARIFPNVIADLHGRMPTRGEELDDDVEGRGFLAVRRSCEIILTMY